MTTKNNPNSTEYEKQGQPGQPGQKQKPVQQKGQQGKTAQGNWQGKPASDQSWTKQ